MNNKDFISELSKKTGLSQEDTQRTVSTLIKALGKCFEEGHDVQIPQVGAFEVKKHKERVLVNTTTQQRKLLPPQVTLHFVPEPVIPSQMMDKEGGK